MRILKREAQTLSTPLMPDELLAKAAALAETHERLSLEREAQKETRAEMKKQLEELEQKRNHLARIVQRKAEDRVVDVEVYAVDTQGIARTVRLDTGEVVEERPLTAQERQLGLTLVPDADTEPKSPKGSRTPAPLH